MWAQFIMVNKQVILGRNSDLDRRPLTRSRPYVISQSEVPSGNHASLC